MTDSQDIYALYEKMGCSLEIRISSKGEGTVKAEVRFLAGDSEPALNVIGSLIAAGLERVRSSFYQEADDGEVELDAEDIDSSDFGLRKRSR